MKRLPLVFLILLILLALMACEQPTATEMEQAEAPNTAPTVKLFGGDTIIQNGQNQLISAEIDDPDTGDTHSFRWFVDDILQSNEIESDFIFSRSPEIETVYAIQIIVTDGGASARAGAVITVLEPPWAPEPWHIYILDAADTILFDYETATPTDYYYMLQAVKMTVEIHNRDFPDKWHYVAGGTA